MSLLERVISGDQFQLSLLYKECFLVFLFLVAIVAFNIFLFFNEVFVRGEGMGSGLGVGRDQVPCLAIT